MHRVTSVDAPDPSRRAARRLGFWAAVMTTVFAVVAFAIAVGTPPLSGPGCQSGCFNYPYSDIAQQVPRDYIWMYPAFLLMPTFVILVACIHHYAEDGKKLYSQIGLVFAAISAAMIAVDYYVQVAVLQPSLLLGEMDGVPLLTQYNPHGVFIALENVGYLLLGLSFLFVALALSGPARLERAVRWILAGGSLLTILGFFGMHLAYRFELEYRFEVFAIAIDWMALIVAGVLLSILFRRAIQPEHQPEAA
jgi:hypothetical protein